MQQIGTPTSGLGSNLGTGGFLKPEKIAFEFGLSERMSVADFGAGAGYFTILMAKKVGKDGMVYALDVQEPALDSVRVKAKAEGIENIQMIRANLEVLGSSGLSDQSQDMVLLANILFQSQQKADIMKEANRILKPGGSLVVIDWKIGAGGFGPPDELRTDEIAMRSLVMNEGLIFEREIDTGQFHYGLKFRKK